MLDMGKFVNVYAITCHKHSYREAYMIWILNRSELSLSPITHLLLPLLLRLQAIPHSHSHCVSHALVVFWLSDEIKGTQDLEIFVLMLISPSFSLLLALLSVKLLVPSLSLTHNSS